MTTRTGVLACAALAAAVAVVGAGRSAAAPTAVGGDAVVFAYLADNTLVRTDEQLRSWRVARIAPRSSAVRYGTPSSLALSRDRRTLWALSTAARRVASVSPETLALRRAITFPSGQAPRAVVIGPRTGRLYIAYVIEHPVQGRRDPPREARLRVMNPAGLQRLADIRVRAAEGRSWWVHSLAVDDAEKSLYVSYHGSDTSGLDRFAISGSKLTRCQRVGRIVCWGQPHGYVVAAGPNVYTATGAPWLAEYEPNGTLSRRLETGLKGVHLMEFAMSHDRSHLYAVSSCSSAGSTFARVDLSNGNAVTVPSAACGSAIDTAASVVLVGTAAQADPSPARPGKLLAVDPSTGSIARQRMTSSEPVDVLAVR